MVPKKTPKKNGSEKKHPTKLMDPPKTFLSESWRNSAGSGIQTPPFTTMAGDYASYNDCGVVNGITADAFIVAG